MRIDHSLRSPDHFLEKAKYNEHSYNKKCKNYY